MPTTPEQIAEFIARVQATPPTLDVDQLLTDLDVAVADLVAEFVAEVNTYNSLIDSYSAEAVALDLTARTGPVFYGIAKTAATAGLHIDGVKVWPQPDASTSVDLAVRTATARAIDEARLAAIAAD